MPKSPLLKDRLYKLLRQKRPRLTYGKIAEKAGTTNGTVRWYSCQLQKAGEDMTRPRSGSGRGAHAGKPHAFKSRPGPKRSHASRSASLMLGYGASTQKIAKKLEGRISRARIYQLKQELERDVE